MRERVVLHRMECKSNSQPPEEYLASEPAVPPRPRDTAYCHSSCREDPDLTLAINMERKRYKFHTTLTPLPFMNP